MPKGISQHDGIELTDSDGQKSSSLTLDQKDSSSSSASATSQILIMFNIAMKRIQIASIIAAVLHLIVFSFFMWITAVEFSISIVVLSLVGLFVSGLSIWKVVWVIKGTKKDAEPNYAWLTDGFMWSVINLFIANFAICPIIVLLVCHVKGTHFMDIMFKDDEPDNWKDHKPLLFAIMLIHALVTVFFLISDIVWVKQISGSLLRGEEGDTEQNQNEANDDDNMDDDDDDDDDDLGPITKKHKTYGKLAIFMDAVLMIDFLVLAIVPGQAHSGLIIAFLLTVVLLVYRTHIVRKCYFSGKMLEEEVLVNYRIFCILHCVLIYVCIWVDIQVVVMMIHFHTNSFFSFMFSLPPPFKTQVPLLIVFFVMGMIVYIFLLYNYQKCMWFADKIESEKLADKLIAAEEENDEGDDDNQSEETDNLRSNDEKQEDH